MDDVQQIKDFYRQLAVEEDARDGGPVELTDEEIAEAAKTIEGTEKQVLWAAKIKAEKMKRMRVVVPRLAMEEGAPEEEAQAILAKALKLAEEQTAAWWWIDRRNDRIEHLLERLNDDARRGVGRLDKKPAPESDLLY